MTKKSDTIRLVLIDLESSQKELAKLFLRERRQELKDRRKLNTYIADDRRDGIIDRRKPKK